MFLFFFQAEDGIRDKLVTGVQTCALLISSSLVQRTADPEANIIFGTVIDKAMTEDVKITVIATGFNRDGRAAAEVVAAQRGFGQRHAVSEPVGVQARAARDLDSPTFLRRAPVAPSAPSGRGAEGGAGGKKRGPPPAPLCFPPAGEPARRSAIFDDAGADDLIMKPFQYEEVETRVRTMLKKREVFRALEQANVELRRTNERMARLIQYDEKTGLFNYRHFMERMAEEVKRARRYGNRLTLAIFDVDHFKGVNDRYGHPAGDRVLREFGEIMVRSSRETDIIARYGGEEFVALLPQTTAVHGQRLAERIRRVTETHPVHGTHPPQPVIRITVSAGVATFPLNDRIQRPEDFVKAADDALYRAKDAGRNRTHLDQRSLSSGR